MATRKVTSALEAPVPTSARRDALRHTYHWRVPSIDERVVGSALGLALGDALGAPFEFLRARNIPEPIPALERPWLSEPPG